MNCLKIETFKWFARLLLIFCCFHTFSCSHSTNGSEGGGDDRRVERKPRSTSLGSDNKSGRRPSAAIIEIIPASPVRPGFRKESSDSLNDLETKYHANAPTYGKFDRYQGRLHIGMEITDQKVIGTYDESDFPSCVDSHNSADEHSDDGKSRRKSRSGSKGSEEKKSKKKHKKKAKTETEDER